MPINPLILDKIKNDDISDEIKNILTDILNMEEGMRIANEKSNFQPNIKQILNKYADEDEIREFCERNG